MQVLVVDGRAPFRECLAWALSGEPDLDVVGAAADGEDAVEMTRDLRPDVVVMDLTLPGMTGVEATRRICTEWPQVRVVGLSSLPHGPQADRMLAAGAVAYVSKRDAPEVLLAAIRTAQNGKLGRCDN
jgi:two-component system, NarL family, invasion response regulator UvrY